MLGPILWLYACEFSKRGLANNRSIWEKSNNYPSLATTKLYNYKQIVLHCWISNNWLLGSDSNYHYLPPSRLFILIFVFVNVKETYYDWEEGYKKSLVLCISKAVCVNLRSLMDWLKVLDGAWLDGLSSEAAWRRRHLPPSLRIWVRVRGAPSWKGRTDSHSVSSDTRMHTVARASARVCPQQCGQNT